MQDDEVVETEVHDKHPCRRRLSTKPTVVCGKAKSETIGTFTQIPLKLAYAITIHKFQGQTFDEAIVYPECWDPGQLYTALSRLTDVGGLRLAHHCPDSSLVTSRAVLEFYDSLRDKGRRMSLLR